LKLGRVLLAVSLVVALAVVGLQLLARSISPDRLRPMLESRLSQAIGLEVALGGELMLDPWQLAHLEVRDVTVANFPGRPSPYLLTVAEIRLELALWPLLQRVVSIERIELIDAELRIEPDAEGELPLSPDPEVLDEAIPPDPSGKATMELQVRAVAFENLRVFFDPAGGEDVATIVLSELELTTEDATSPVRVHVEGSYEGSPVVLDAEVGPLRELMAPGKPYPVSLRGRLMETELELDGVIDTPLDLGGIDVAFVAFLEDVERVVQARAMGLPDFGPLRVSGRLRNPDGVFGIDGLEIETEAGGPLEIRVEGSLTDLTGIRGIDVQVHAATSDMDLFEALASFPLPNVPASADVHVADADGSLGLDGEAQAGTSDSVKLSVRGTYDDLRGLSELDLGVLLNAADLETLRRTLEVDVGLPIPRVGPVTASASIRDHDGVFGLDGIDVFAGSRDDVWLALTGSIRDVRRFKGVKLEAKAGGIHTRLLAEHLGRELPDLGRFEITAGLSDADGTLGIERLKAHGGKEELIRIEVHGSFDDIRGTNEIDVTGSLTARDLPVLGEILGMELPPVGPVEFSGWVRGSDERLETKGDLRLRETRFQGAANASFAPNVRPRLVAQMSSPRIHLVDIGIEPDAERYGPSAALDEPSALERWWSGGEPLRISELRAIDLDVQLQADRVSGRRGFELQDVLLYLTLDDGLLGVRRSGGSYEGGEVELELELDASRAEPTWALRAEAYGVEMKKLMSQFERGTESAGLLDVSLDLRTRGATRKDVVSRLGGTAGAMLRNGALVSRGARAFSVNFLRLTIPDFRSDLQSAAPVQCLLAIFKVEDGLAEADQLYLEASDITVVGTGSVDLGRDELAMRLTPRLHEPGLVSVAATVDVSGPIEQPVLTPVKSSLGASAARGLIKNVLRPVRAVLDRRPGVEPEADPCDAVAALRRQKMEADLRDGGPAYDPEDDGALAPAGG
jgi:hypothetical protein